MTESVPMPERAPAQRPKRDSLFLLADFHREDGGVVGPARIRNLSATGLMAECTHPVVEGDRLRFTLRGVGDVRASVSWREGERIGLAFDERIDPLAVRRPVGAGNGPDTDAYRLPLYRAPVRRRPV